MKKVIIIAFFFGITNLGMAQKTRDTLDTSYYETYIDTVYTTYKSKKKAYTKKNLAIQCPLDCKDKPCKIQKQKIEHLAYWKKMFNHLNYIYKHKIQDVDKVDKMFLEEFKITTDTKRGVIEYSVNKDYFYMFMSTKNNKIKYVYIIFTPPPIECCNKNGKAAAGIEFKDYRVLNYLDIKIPLERWDSNMEPNITFAWDYTYYEK